MKKFIILFLVLFPQFVCSQNEKDSTYQTTVIHDNLPSFYKIVQDRLNYPLSWLSGNFSDFNSWRTAARSKVMECLFSRPPSIPYHPVVIAEQDRGSYIACKIVLNITADSRVLGYLLVPKGKGPFPAVLLLHDHGAKFDIGKEKMVEPFADSVRRIQSAREWVDKNYGGRFVGDELAKRGYVCFATDVLNWSDRGGGGYEGQQAIASNLLNMGMSYAGLIAWEDMNAAEFLATRPEVDSTKVIALGFSMGSFRAWQVAALSDRIAGSVSICWFATRTGLLVPGGNLTRGQSSFTTSHPGLANYLDYADVASIACPKPMLFFNGEQDKLFPAASVKEGYAKLHTIWDSQNAGDRLVTKFWNTGHIFNREMQDEVFQWLNKVCKR
jgi:dienelactone hydrolase